MLIEYNPGDGKTYEGHYNPAGQFIRSKGYYFRTHAMGDCEGRNCSIHNPSAHRMASLPLNWRSDRGIMERICEHGIGHDDPDDLTYRRSAGGNDTSGIHGCDGCCVEL